MKFIPQSHENSESSCREWFVNYNPHIFATLNLNYKF